jgi:phenylacetic acid degradation operon negative regulatory protein
MTAINTILSSISAAPTSDFVYSSLSFFGRQRGGELPGRWFVEALGALGVEEQAVRQTLFRMEASHALLARREGRIKWYRPSPTTQAVLDAGVARVRTPAEDAWDGAWTLVHFRLGEQERERRDRVRDVLLVEGFGTLGPGLYIHPRDRTERLLVAAEALGLRHELNVFRGVHVAGMDDPRLVLSLWDIPALAGRYRRFLRRFAPVARVAVRDLSPREAFGLRFACMFEIFRISWDDPSLPSSLLPAEWPGEEARVLAARLIESLLPGAMAFGDEVLVRLTSPASAPAPAARRRRA